MKEKNRAGPWENSSKRHLLKEARLGWDVRGVYVFNLWLWGVSGGKEGGFGSQGVRRTIGLEGNWSFSFSEHLETGLTSARVQSLGFLEVKTRDLVFHFTTTLKFWGLGGLPSVTLSKPRVTRSLSPLYCRLEPQGLGEKFLCFCGMVLYRFSQWPGVFLRWHWK